jgi:flagellar hook assembly protein FlgD
VRLAVYDAGGRQVTVLVDEAHAAGRHTARWDGRDAVGRDVADGVYFVRLEAGDRSMSRKLVVAR